MYNENPRKTLNSRPTFMKFRGETVDCIMTVESNAHNGLIEMIAEANKDFKTIDCQYGHAYDEHNREHVYSALLLLQKTQT